jgi:hypothetical protein
MRIKRIHVHDSITDERIVEAVERQMCSLDNPGFCIVCGVDIEGVDPDTRGAECESCGAESGVYGAEELLIRLSA